MPVKAMVMLPSGLSRLWTAYEFIDVTDAPVATFVQVIRAPGAATTCRVRAPVGSNHEMK